ncbi:MAG: type I-E CRISPR-associated protein Cas7/Cse4/CasC, partial [Lachnospiraceae bacterium]
KGTDALFFMSQEQAKALAKLAAEGCEDKKAYKGAIAANPSVDMVLFGRMVASDPSLNYDAAAQVAHAISTHRVQNEYDYFTAVDDCKSEESAGAGHVGDVEFNSATLYRYATVNVCELMKHIGKETPKVVRGFAEAFVRAMPTGKQNTFANRTLPDAVYVTVRCDQPVNLSGAFEMPVNGKEGYVTLSEKRLVEFAQKTYNEYVEQPVMALAVGDAFGGIARVLSLKELLNTLEEWVEEHLTDCEVV